MTDNKIKPNTKQKPDDFDRYAGQRLRMMRSLLGVTQQKLATDVGLTFQQIQKYERGANRMSAGMLYKFSRIFDVPFEYFADGFADDMPQSTFHDVFMDQKTLKICSKYKRAQDKHPEIYSIMRDMLNIFLKD